MKYGKCARCGKRIIVSDAYDPERDMEVCFACDERLRAEFEERQE